MRVSRSEVEGDVLILVSYGDRSKIEVLAARIDEGLGIAGEM